MDDEPQFSWDIEIPGVGEVWLRAEGEGTPTQTWFNGVLVEREPAGKVAWSRQSGLPDLIETMNKTIANAAAEVRCFLLKGEASTWAELAANATNEGGRVRALAFRQHALNLRSEYGCD